MADIFLSYAREDRAQAEPVAHALEGEGWSVWWDRLIPTGKTFDEVIDEELQAARCVVVLWTAVSVKKEWVKEEAQDGADHDVLVPVRLEDVKLPRGFRRKQAADLIGWNGSTEFPAFKQLVKDLAALLSSDDDPVGVRNAELDAVRSKEGFDRARTEQENRAAPEGPAPFFQFTTRTTLVSTSIGFVFTALVFLGGVEGPDLSAWQIISGVLLGTFFFGLAGGVIGEGVFERNGPKAQKRLFAATFLFAGFVGLMAFSEVLLNFLSLTTLLGTPMDVVVFTSLSVFLTAFVLKYMSWTLGK